MLRCMLFLLTCLLAACGGGGDPRPAPPEGAAQVSGTLAGSLAGATVTAYAVAADGGDGAALGSATSDDDGAFTLVLSALPANGLRLRSIGGRYVLPADAARRVSAGTWSALLATVGAQGVQGVVLSPFTTFVDRRSVALVLAATGLAAALDRADGDLRAIYGLPGDTPLWRLLPDDRASSGAGAMLAWLFGALAQQALLVDRTPPEIEAAHGADFSDGVFDGRDAEGASLRYDATTTAPASLTGSDFLAALRAYLSPANGSTLVVRNGVTPDAGAVQSIEGAVVAGAGVGADGVRGNNAALLSGPALGRAVAPVSSLRKPLSIGVAAHALPLVFGTPMATRTSLTSDAMYVVLPITHVGDQPLCFIQLSSKVYRDAAGVALGNAEISYLSGSIGRLTSVTTDTCLWPGETGFLTDIDTVGYERAARLEFAVSVSTSSSTASRPAAVVRPQAYTGGGSSFSVSLRNTGSAPAVFSIFSEYVLFDEGGLPLGWSYLGTSAPAVLAAGATSSVPGTVSTDGQARRLYVQLDFEDGASATSGQAVACSDAGTVEAMNRCRKTVRQMATRRLQDEAERAAVR